MSPDNQTIIFIVVLVSVMGVATVAAFVKFFADDRNRVAATQLKQRDLEQPYRDALGEFADIDKSHMTHEIEAKMTPSQRRQWVDLQVLHGMYKQQQNTTLDLFGPMSRKDKLKRIAKMLGICILILLAWLVSAVIDDALGLRAAPRRAPVSFAVALLCYLLFVVVRARRSMR